MPNASPSRALALLNGKTNRYGQSGHSRDSLKESDVAGALGFVKNRIGTMILRVKWAHQESMIWFLHRACVDELKARAKALRWKAKNTEVYTALAWLALRELEIIRPYRRRDGIGMLAFSPGAEKCPDCRGTRRRFSKRYNKWFDCGRCNASGQRIWKDSERAAHLRIHHSSWPTWKRRYENFREFLKQSEIDAHRKTRRKLV